MKPFLAAALTLATAATLAACAEEKSVANRFEEASNEIVNAAQAGEALVENRVKAATDALDADVNRVEVNVVVENQAAANQQ